MNNNKKFISYIKKHSGFAERNKERDLLLDFAKGVAIILVVLGHTFQGQTEKFDESYGFRFIYSFHMPLFAFLAGASAVFWVKNFDISFSGKELAKASLYRIRRSAEHLLLPFVSWTLIGYWMSNNQESINDYLWKVFKQPDYSLWFLPCVFWCTAYVALFMLGMSLTKRVVNQGLRTRIE